MDGGSHSFSHSQAMHFSLGHIFLKLVYCGHTYACVDSFEYQVIHDMNYNHALICWKVLFLAGPCIVELASIHNSLKSDERRKWDQRNMNPWNNLNVKPIFFSLVMCACFHSFSFGDIKKLDIEVAIWQNSQKERHINVWLKCGEVSGKVLE